MEKVLSFIVIGRNEGWKLVKCLESINNEISYSLGKGCEVIYIDSQSTDGSIEVAKEFPGTRIFRLVGPCNAAIARNVGAKESKGDLLFFLDGDMELKKGFIEEALRLSESNYEFIGGQIEECYYDENWSFLGRKKIFPDNMLNSFNLTNGGAFVIKKELWDSVSGMRTKYERSQDIDLNYRLIKKGKRIFRSGKTYVTHHTIQYSFNTNVIDELLKFRKYLFKGVLIRDHILNYKIAMRNVRINYSLFIFIFLIICAIVFDCILWILPYLGVVFLRSLSQYQKYKRVVKSRLLHFYLKNIYLDVTAISGFLFFYPIDKQTSYESIK